MLAVGKSRCRPRSRPFSLLCDIHTGCRFCLVTMHPRFYSVTHVRYSGHYRTLGVPRHASKSQIKSSFYKLSKICHPDVTQDPGAKEKFQAASEAYAVLGDDRKRRAYDRSLTTVHSPSDSSHQPSPSYHTYDTARRRGATHAWSHPRPSQFSHAKTSGSSHRNNSFHPSPRAGHHYDPFSSSQKATGQHSKKTAADHIIAESSTWRVVQVIGVILVVITVGGGFQASV